MGTSGWLIAVALVAGINPFRLAPGLPRGDRSRSERVLVAALGAGAAGAVLVGLGAVGPAAIDWLSVSDPTMRVAAGVVLSVAGVVALVVGGPAAEPSLAGRGAALVPVAVPFVLRPEVGLVAVSGGADGHLGAVAGGVLAAVVLVALAALSDLDDGSVAERVQQWSGRLVAAVCLLAGLALLVSGVLDV